MLDLSMTVQAATVARLEALNAELAIYSTPGERVMVEAWAMPEPTTELCSEDNSHGPGLVQVPIRTTVVEGTDADGHLVFGPSRTIIRAQCLACAIKSVRAMVEDGQSSISLDVTAASM